MIIYYQLDLKGKELLAYLIIHEKMREDFDFMAKERVSNIIEATNGQKTHVVLQYIFGRGLEAVMKELELEGRLKKKEENKVYGPLEKDKDYIIEVNTDNDEFVTPGN